MQSVRYKKSFQTVTRKVNNKLVKWKSFIEELEDYKFYDIWKLLKRKWLTRERATRLNLRNQLNVI